MESLTREIKLGKSGKVAIVDAEDYDRVGVYKWYLSKDGYAITTYQVARKRYTVGMHRLVNETPPEYYTDHVDRNKLNNTRANLRSVTPNQNSQRAITPRSNTSGYRGVSWNKEAKRWQAKITVKNRLRHIGHFQDKTEAACAYNWAAIKYFGSFASLNKIEAV